jgi:hypothetical protein
MLEEDIFIYRSYQKPKERRQAQVEKVREPNSNRTMQLSPPHFGHIKTTVQ